MSRMKWMKSQSLPSLESPPQQQQKFLPRCSPNGFRKPYSPLTRLSTNSLNKKPRRTVGHSYKMFRRSCRSEGGSQEELMKMSLLENCQGITASQRKLETENLLEEFLQDYSKCCEWLNEIQLARGQCANQGRLDELALKLRLNKPFRGGMMKRAKELSKLVPQYKEEFVWRSKHLNSQWDALEELLNCASPAKLKQGNVLPSLENENAMSDVDWLKDWLQRMELELRPLTFKNEWSADEFQEELSRHKALQAEIDEKCSRVHLILRECQSEGRDSIKQRKRAENLEGRWIQLRLRVLEWVEHLTATSAIQTKNRITSQTKSTKEVLCTLDLPSSAAEYFCEEGCCSEPLRKYPKLGDSHLSPAEKNFCCQSTNTNSITGTTEFFPFIDTSIYTADQHPLLFDESAADSDWIMGQIQEAESAYQSLSPVPNTVIEFTFDGSSESSLGLKRKLSPLSSPLSEQQNLLLQTVAMNKNVSTYYFKHSDTEDYSTTKPEIAPATAINANYGHGGHEQNTLNELRTKDRCQQQNFALDQLQEQQKINRDEDYTWNCVVPESEIESSNVQSQLDDSKEPDNSASVVLTAAMEDMEAKNLQNLNEIEELVQKVESLIKSSRNHFTTATTSSNTSADQDGYEMSEEDEQEQLLGCTSSANPVPSTSGKFLKKSKRHFLSDNSRDGLRKNDGMAACESEVRKLPKKHSRVKQWIQAQTHSNKITGHHRAEQKNTSSCDASAESASETDPDSDPQLSSDDPTTVCASTVQQQQQRLFRKHGHGSSSNNTVNKLSPSTSTSGGVLGVVLRKKRSSFIKQRPKSFTDTLFSPIKNSTCRQPTSSPKRGEYFVSDTALNFIQSGTASGSSSPRQSTDYTNSGKKRHFKKKLFRNKKRSFDYAEEDELELIEGLMRSTSFSGEISLNTQAADEVDSEVHVDKENSASTKPFLLRVNSDNTSVNTEEVPPNDQDWDSYQEKYLSEPYSEELYDQDRTLKLLAFGEDYDQVLDRADSESSSLFSGFESTPSKRRPLKLKNSNEMQESDSDREEFNHFLTQSRSQLHFLDVVFRKQLANSAEGEAEFAEMEATCDENINSLKLVLSNLENPGSLGIDIKSIEAILEQWNMLKEKIIQAAKLQEVQEEMNALQTEFDNLAFSLGQVDPFDANDLNTLVHKIGIIQDILIDLNGKKERVQSLNEASLGAHLYLKDSNVSEGVKKQMQELYALYEENYQLGSYLLSKMKYLQSAWEEFEAERLEFEKCISNSGNTNSYKSKRDLSSSASTDSGHGTDFSHDSSISDSDHEFKEKKQKLAALKKKASDLRSFIPPGSPVLDSIDKKINDAQRDFETLRKLGHFDPVDLKIIYPKRRSPFASARPTKVNPRPSPVFEKPPLTKRRSTSPTKKTLGRNWRIIKLSLGFHLALLGLFAVAWFLQPRCCENTNTFCFSLIPHLSHEKMPHM